MLKFHNESEEISLHKSDSGTGINALSIEKMVNSLYQFSSGVVQPWETVLEMDEDADDGSIIFTRKLKLFLNDEGKKMLEKKKNQTDMREDDQNKLTFFQHEEALNRDTLRKRKEDIMQTGRYLRQFDKSTEKLLGKGGFGTVMVIKDRLEDVYYAVKKVRLHLPKNGDFEENIKNHRVFREVTALSKTTYQEMKHVVRFYNSWLEDLSVKERKEE